MSSDNSKFEPESTIEYQENAFSFPSPSNDLSNSLCLEDDDAVRNLSRRNNTTTNSKLKSSSRDSASSSMPEEKI